MNDKKNGAKGAKTNGNPEQAEQAEQAQAEQAQAEQAQAEQAEQSQAKQAKSGAGKLGGTRAEERIAALDTEGASVSAEVEELAAKLEAAEQCAEAAEAGWQRARADYQNLKRRSEEQRAESASIAGDRLLIRVLDLADDFDLAVEHVPEEAQDSPWVEGITAIDRKLRALLEAHAGFQSQQSCGVPADPNGRNTGDRGEARRQ